MWETSGTLSLMALDKIPAQNCRKDEEKTPSAELWNARRRMFGTFVPKSVAARHGEPHPKILNDPTSTFAPV